MSLSTPYTSDSDGCTRRISSRFYPWIIVVVVVAIYAGVAYHPFFPIDDTMYVTSNLMVRQGLSYAGIQWACTTLFFGNWAPLTWISLMMDTTLFGQDPWGYHLTNVLLHAITAVTFFIVLKRGTGESFSAACAALLFALHPLAVEPVCWIASRKDLLSGLLWMITILAYLSYAERKTWCRYAAVFFFLALGLSAKGSLVCLPPLLLLIDVWPLNRLKTKRAVFLALLEKLPLCILCAGYVVLTAHAQALLGATALYPPLPFGQRMMEIFFYYGVHLEHFLLPTTPVFPYPQSVISPSCALLWMVFIAAATTAASLAVTSAPWIFVGWWWWLLALLPFVRLVPVGYEPVADRWNYMPSCGLALLVAFTLERFAKRLRVKPAVSLCCALFILSALAFLTWQRTRLWQDPLFVLEDSLARYPEQFNAHAYLAAYNRAEQKFPEAVVNLQAAVRANPFGVLAFGTLGQTLNTLGRAEDLIAFIDKIPSGQDPYSQIAAGRYLHTFALYPASRTLFKEMLRQDPADVAVARLSQAAKDPAYEGEAEAWIGRVLLIDRGCAEASEHFSRALQSRPADSVLHSNSGACYLLLGQTAKAIEHLARSIELAPTSADTYLRLAQAQQALDLRPEALASVDKALSLSRDLAGAYSLKGSLYLAENNLIAARDALERSVLLDPTSEEAHNTLGLVAFKEGNYEAAVVSFRRAATIAPTSATIQHNLRSALLRANVKSLDVVP